MYDKSVGNDIILLVICVDDIIITGSEESAIKQNKSNMNKTFDMNDLGLPHYYLGVEVWKTSSNIFVSQNKYSISSFNRFIMKNSKISSTPMEKGINRSTILTQRKLMIRSTSN